MKKYLVPAICALAFMASACPANVKTSCLGYARSVQEQTHSAQLLVADCRGGSEPACAQLTTTLHTVEATSQAVVNGRE